MTVVPLFVFAASAHEAGEEKERHTEFGLQARQLSIFVARTTGYTNPWNYPRQPRLEARISS
jgi:hypothetical protein